MNALVLGFGLVGRSIGTKLSTTNLFNRIIVVDKLDKADVVEKVFANSETTTEFHLLKIAPKTLGQLRNLIEANGVSIVIDCSYNIDTLSLLQSLPEGVAFINTSVEEWPSDDAQEIPVFSTLKKRQVEIRKWYNKTKPNNNILLDCGMNPGLVNLWAWDCARKNNFNFDEITQVIVSEVDTQRAKVGRKDGEFVNTWSPNGFLEEVHAPIEGYSLGEYFSDDTVTGYETISRSIRPNGKPFHGFTVRHAETITMNKLFPNATLMYIYKCPEEAIGSLFEYNEVRPIESERMLYTPDIVEGGIDELGLVMADDSKVVWYGSMLSNEHTKRLGPLAPFVNATSVQVVGGLWIGINFLLKQNEMSVYRLMTPEDITEDEQFLEEILEEVNADLQMKTVVFPRDHPEARNVIVNKSFTQKFKKNFTPVATF